MHLVLNAPYELALIVLQTTGRVRRRPSRAVHFCWQVAARQPNLRWGTAGRNIPASLLSGLAHAPFCPNFI